jgi:chromosomal replication initiation ATPase DnaA
MTKKEVVDEVVNAIIDELRKIELRNRVAALVNKRLERPLKRLERAIDKLGRNHGVA